MTGAYTDQERFANAIDLAARLIRQMQDDRHAALLFALEYWKVPESKLFEAQTALLRQL